MRSQTQEFRGRLRLGQGRLRRGDAQGDNEAEPSGLAEGGRGQEPSRHPAPGDRQGPGPGSANRSYGRAAQGRLLGPARGAARPDQDEAARHVGQHGPGASRAGRPALGPREDGLRRG